MIPIIIWMLFVPTLALALIFSLNRYFSRKIAIASTFLGFMLTLVVLAVSLINGKVNVLEIYPYLGSLMISLSFRINAVSLMLLLMSSIVLLSAVIAGNPENEKPKVSSALIVMFQIASVGLSDTLHQNLARLVLAGLELVADHGHLGIEKLLLDARIDHAVGFQFQRPAQVFVAGVEGLEIVGAVVIRGAVHFGAMVGQLLLDIGPRLGLDEVHVLQQVGHAGLAISFVTASPPGR